MYEKQPTKFFAINETHTREDYDNRPVEDEYFVYTEDNTHLMVFAEESEAAEYMVEKGYKTYHQVRDEYHASLMDQYNKDMRQYVKDVDEVEKMRALGASTRLLPKLSRPVKPSVPQWWIPPRYYEIVPVCVMSRAVTD